MEENPKIPDSKNGPENIQPDNSEEYNSEEYYSEENNSEENNTEENKVVQKQIPDKVAGDEITVEISQDKMQAFITVNPAVPENLPVTDDLRNILFKNKVVYNVNETILGKIIPEGLFERKILVASGLEPVLPVDGKIKYLVDLESIGKAKVDDHGNVDFRNIGTFINVEKDMELARIIPPVEGRDGKTVTGDAITVKEGKPYKLPIGKNTTAKPDNNDILIAEMNGAVRLRDNYFVDIDPVLEIKSHVDFSTGNIDYNGSLTIRGDIKAGFDVKVEGNLEVFGLIEECHVEAGGDIVIRQGCKGKGEGLIRAGGSIALKFGENHILEAGKDILSGDYLMNCKAYASDTIKAVGKTGLLIGGELVAKNGIEAKNVGNYQGVRTVLSVGADRELLEKFNHLKSQRKTVRENLDKVNNAIKILHRIVLMKGSLPEDKKEIQIKLLITKKKLDEANQQLIEQNEALLNEISMLDEIYILVHGTVFNGTVLIFLYNKKVVGDDLKKVIFKLKDGEIALSSLTDKE